MTNQLPEPLDVIAVGAHPDDVEIGCGGTLAKLVSQGLRVGVVDITDGEPTPRSSGPEERLAEASEAAGVLGVVHREQLGFPNRKLFELAKRPYNIICTSIKVMYFCQIIR